MTLTETSARSVQIYLKSLRRELSDLLDEDANEIVEEIRTHIFDKTTGETPESVAATLAALGTPQELADRYRTPELIERAKLARSPKYILRRTMRRWAGECSQSFYSPSRYWAAAWVAGSSCLASSSS